MEILNDILLWSEFFINIRNKSTSNWNDSEFFEEISVYLKKIYDLDAVFVYPVILAGYKQYLQNNDDPHSFLNLIKLCFMYHVRIKIIGTSMSLGDYEQTMFEIASFILHDVNLRDIINKLVNSVGLLKYPSNKSVTLNLEEFKITSKKHTKILLDEIVFHETKQRALDYHVEYIMPKKFDSWKNDIMKMYNYDANKAKTFNSTYREYLGNKTLLFKKLKSSESSKSFDIKKIMYGQEPLQITSKLTDEVQWGEDEILKRQKKFAKILTSAIDITKLYKYS